MQNWVSKNHLNDNGVVRWARKYKLRKRHGQPKEWKRETKRAQRREGKVRL